MRDSALPAASGSTASSRHHVAVYLTADTASYQAIDAACEQARIQDAAFSAFYIDSSASAGMLSRSGDEQALQELINYASSLGAHIDAVNGSNAVFLVSEYCKSHHVDLLVLNRPLTRRGFQRFRSTFAQQVANRIPETRLLTVPGQMTIHFRHLEPDQTDLSTMGREFFRVALILAATTLLCVLLDHFLDMEEFALAQIVMIGVLLCSVNTNHWGWAMVSALVSVAIFIFLFAQPRYTFFYLQPKLTDAFVMTFLTSLIGGFIGTRLHRENQRAVRSSWGTQVLLDTTHLLQNCQSADQIVATVARKLADVTEKNVVYYPYIDEVLEDPLLFPFNPTSSVNREELECELIAVKAAVAHNTNTGSRTQIFPEASYMYFPWRSETTIYGVIGIRLDQEIVTPLELMILSNIVAEGVLSLEAKLKGDELQRMQMKAESDQLRSNLLKALSHDIRTPLTSIMGNVAYIQSSIETSTLEQRKEIWKNIQDDSLNMYNMIENLLTAARLDNNSVEIKPHPELLDDVIEAGLDFPIHTNETHPIDVDESDEILMVNMDPTLIAQVISNMVLNAIHHTPDGTPISVRSFRDGNDAVVEVADTGHGVSDAMKERIFDIFYTGEQPSYDSTHYLGLGLFLCKEIIDAHKGQIAVRDNDPSGCVFSFRLPVMDLSAAG